MKLSTLLALSLSFLTSAIPTTFPSYSDLAGDNTTTNKLQANMETGTVGGILICNGPNASPACIYDIYQMEICYDLPVPFLRNASTFVLDDGEWYCYPYILDPTGQNSMSCGGICTSPEGCTLGGVSPQYEHRFNLSAVGWGHYISSFECHLGVAPVVP
ncbi:hypothetical protein B0T20DRAFT_488628 [Sordaria brevicollis]|uniref:Uncharacterized protein n=1 Tax=Sordaria brevicollis TaxID=83679 RepID=A0AAE0U5L9_SORBR|nr:hypothetical protein B0T20DRAFT_488628 [Sordaria brevicollis]